MRNLIISFHFVSAFYNIRSEGNNLCTLETKNYLKCVTKAQEIQSAWSFRRPFSDHNEVNQCFERNGCKSPSNYSRSLFADFVPLWQSLANEMWKEFLKTPMSVKHCIRGLVKQVSQARINVCLQQNGLSWPDDSYVEDLELPLCMQASHDNVQLKAMQAALAEKTVVLRKLYDCKIMNKTQSVTKTIRCLDGLKKRLATSKLCPLENICINAHVSSGCRSHVRQIIYSTCSCNIRNREAIFELLDVMYETSSVQVLKLTVAFFGLELTEEMRQLLKQCYTDRGFQPIGFLYASELPLTGLFNRFKPKPKGFRNLKNLVFAQLDTPAMCERC